MQKEVELVKFRGGGSFKADVNEDIALHFQRVQHENEDLLDERKTML